MVTKARFQGSLGGPAGADVLCQSEFGSGWKALLVGGGRRATITPNKGDGATDWVIAKYTHYFNELNQLTWRTDGVALLGVRDGKRLPVYADAYHPDFAYPWGGYSADWTTLPEVTGDGETHSGTCVGWTSAAYEAKGTFPFANLNPAAAEPCNHAQPLLCVQQ